MNHEWHVAINRFNEGRHGGEWRHWMYEAKNAAGELPRLALLFGLERRGELPKVHVQCSLTPAEPVVDNRLTCCLGVVCRECPELKAIETARMVPDEIDKAKAWTCVAHILSEGGDTAGEGYILSTDDRMYWDRVYEHMSAPEPDPDAGNDFKRENPPSLPEEQR